MIALIIIGAILLILAAILFLPVDAVFRFKEEIFFKVKFSGITVFKLKPKDEEKEKTEEKPETDAKPQPKKENTAISFFKKLKEKYGFSGAVKQIFGFVRDLFPHIKSLLKHIKIKRVGLDIIIAEGDAAKTAIEYGSVCAVVYPVLAAAESIANIEYKAINIRSDFEGSESEFSFKATVRTRIFFLLIALIKIYSEYKKFTARIENNE